MKTIKTITLLASVLFSATLLDAQDINNARQLIDNERYSSAEILLENATANGQANPEMNYLLVKTYLEQDKTKDAGEFVETHLKTMGNDADPLNRVAYTRYLVGTGNKSAAIEIMNSLLADKKNRKNVPLLLAMSEVMIDEEQGDARLALDWLDMAAKREKNNPAIDILKGKAYRRIADASSAYTAYQDALKNDPMNVKANYEMGKIFRAQKNPGVYMPYFEKAYQLDSTFAPVLEELYNHYYYRDLQLARKYLEKYMANTDYSLQNDYYMTDILYLTGDYDKAINAANQILSKEKKKSQPRLYKLIAYSFAKKGDSTKALENLHTYFAKEQKSKLIAADYELRAELTEKIPSAEDEAIEYYTKAAELDSLIANKANYASAIARLYKITGDFSGQADWLGRFYQWKEKTNNVDLFNWGLAHYNAKEYQKTDSVFSLYTTRYPEDIYGYYWRAQANAAIDTSMTSGLVIPHYNKVVEIGELDKVKNKKMLLTAYGYLGGYEANISKDYKRSLSWFEKYRELDNTNENVQQYIETLKKWIADNKPLE